MFRDMHFSAETKIFFMRTKKQRENAQTNNRGKSDEKNSSKNVDIANIILFRYNSRAA